jgi:hypothetical protein
VIDGLHMYGHNLRGRQFAAHLADGVGSHRDRLADQESRGSRVDHDHVWAVGLHSSLYFGAPDRVTRDIERRLARRLQREAGDRPHFLVDFTRAVLSTRSVEVDSPPLDVIIDGRDGREPSFPNRPVAFRLAKDRDTFGQQFNGPRIPMIAVGMRDEDNVDCLQQSPQFAVRQREDEFVSYRGLFAEFAQHETVDHGSGEYVRGDIFTNTAESWFALLKRGVYGTFHHVSKQHLDRYVSEFAFRWNHRKESDAERTMSMLGAVTGKRLYYKGVNGSIMPTKKSSKTTNEKPVSLYPLNFEDALCALTSTPPPESSKQPKTQKKAPHSK